LTELLFWYTHGVYCNKSSNFKIGFFFRSIAFILWFARVVSAMIIRSFYLASAQAMKVPSFLSGFWLSFILLPDFHVLPTFKPSSTVNSHPILAVITSFYYSTHYYTSKPSLRIHTSSFDLAHPTDCQSKSVKNRFERWLFNATPEPGLPIPPKDQIVNPLARDLPKDLVLSPLPPYLSTHTFSTSPVLHLAM
jgi:hypothetical protein